MYTYMHVRIDGREKKDIRIYIHLSNMYIGIYQYIYVYIYIYMYVYLSIHTHI